MRVIDRDRQNRVIPLFCLSTSFLSTSLGASSSQNGQAIESAVLDVDFTTGANLP